MNQAACLTPLVRMGLFWVTVLILTCGALNSARSEDGSWVTYQDEQATSHAPQSSTNGVSGRILDLAKYAYEGPGGRPRPGADNSAEAASFVDCINLTAKGVLMGRPYKARHACYPGDQRTEAPDTQ